MPLVCFFDCLMLTPFSLIRACAVSSVNADSGPLRYNGYIDENTNVITNVITNVYTSLNTSVNTTKTAITTVNTVAKSFKKKQNGYV